MLETHLYDSQGRATTSETDGGRDKYTLDYSNSGFTAVTDGLGRVTKYYFTRTGSRNVVSKVEGLCGCGGGGSETTQFVYDDKLNLTKKTDALNRDTIYTYDSDRNVTSVTDTLGTQTFTYNSFGEVLTYRDRIDSQNSDLNIKTVVNTYDTHGNLHTTTDALGKTTTLTYTASGRPATVKDALNHTTTLTWDTQSRLTAITDADNNETIFGYDARARVTSLTNALSEVIAFHYDSNNRLDKVTFPDNHYTTATYDLAGRRTAVTDPLGHSTTFAYDGAYRLTSITDALSHTMNFGYDLMSNITSQTDALGNVTNLEYDDFNRLKKIKYPLPVSGGTRLEENYTYDLVGNVKTRVDTSGRTTSYDYDNANRLIKITDPLTQITQFEYNARSQTTKVTDALSQQYVFTYDPLGRQLSQTRGGTTMSFEYDAVGNRKKRTDYIGRVSQYTYDNLNRLTKIEYGTNPGDGGAAKNYGYDDLSRLISAANEAGTVNFTYDNRNRLKTETDVFGHVMDYSYDAASRRTLLKLDASNYATYTYDIADRLTGITNVADTTTVSYGYDNANRLTSRNYPNSVTSTYEYDGMSRLTRLKDINSTATLFDRQLNYNNANQIAYISGLEYSPFFSYDNGDRLTSTIYGAPLVTSETYVYDAVGNRTASHLSNSYSYQPFNKIAATQTATYGSDANGNTVQKSEGSNFWRYGFDYENQLAKVSTRKQTVLYKYDALGRRVQRAIAGGKENTKFSYDGQDVLLDDDSGTQTKYLNGPSIDNKLRQTVGSNVSYFLADHLGSTTGLTNSTGNLTTSTIYDSFGNASNSSFPSRYQFTGREFDSFSGLQFSRARFYDPKLGRFISEDPIGFNGGDVNLYGYVWNNPQNYIDPEGLFPTGADVADWWDDKVNVAQDFYGHNPVVAWSPVFGPIRLFDALRGVGDPLRVGTGTGRVLFSCEDENIYGKAAFIAMDITRASAIFTTLAGPVAGRFGGVTSESTGFNPFKGKTPPEIDQMLKNRGYQPRGPDPLRGKGGYEMPGGRGSYHIDVNNRFGEPPHVDINRPDYYQGPLNKRKLPM